MTNHSKRFCHMTGSDSSFFFFFLLFLLFKNTFPSRSLSFLVFLFLSVFILIDFLLLFPFYYFIYVRRKQMVIATCNSGGGRNDSWGETRSAVMVAFGLVAPKGGRRNKIAVGGGGCVRKFLLSTHSTFSTSLLLLIFLPDFCYGFVVVLILLLLTDA